MTSKSNSEAYSPSGCYRGVFPSSTSVALASAAAAAAAETAVRSSEGTCPPAWSASPCFLLGVALPEGCMLLL